LGCVKNNISESVANKIFDLIEYFSGYGFNKAHSAAYALIITDCHREAETAKAHRG